MTKKEYDKLSKKLADINETLKDETLLANVRDILTLEREDLIKQMEAYQPKEVDAKEIKESLNEIKNTLAVIIILIILALLIASSQMLNQFQNDQNIMNILNNQSCELDEIKNNYSNVTDTDQYLYEEPEVPVDEQQTPIVEEQQTPIAEDQLTFEEPQVEDQQTFEEPPVEENSWNNNGDYENANSKYNATEGFEEQDTNTYYNEYANNTDEPLLGVLVTETPSELYNSTNVPEGVYVYKVQKHTGAYAAGLQDGDIITSIDGNRVYSLDDIKNILRNYSKGDSVNVEVTHYPYEEFNQSSYYVTLH